MRVMSEGIIKDHEQSYSATCAEITQLTGRIKLSSSVDQLEELSESVEGLFTDAKETLEQIELECHGLEGRAREKVYVRLESYKAELNRLVSHFKTCKTEARHRTDRLELFTRSSDDVYIDVDTESILDSSSKQLEDGRRLLAETEEIGGSVLEDLSSQRETLQRARGRLKDVEAGLGESNSVIKGMIFKARQNRIVLSCIIIVISSLLVWGLYRIFT